MTIYWTVLKSYSQMAFYLSDKINKFLAYGNFVRHVNNPPTTAVSGEQN